MNASDYDAAVRAVEADVIGVAVVKKMHPVDRPATFFSRADGAIVRVDWNGAEPAVARKNAVKAAIEAATPVANRLEDLRAKRRAGEPLTDSERMEVLDLLMGV